MRNAGGRRAVVKRLGPPMNKLKEEYVSGLSAIATSETALSTVIPRLLALGVTRRALVRWGVEAGHTEKHVRSVLSRILCAAGHRRRKPGAGRRVSQDALALLALARSQYAGRAPRLLLAAYRIAKNQEALENARAVAA